MLTLPGYPNLADRAFDDRCTGANPRYPLIEDLRRLLVDTYSGVSPINGSLSVDGVADPEREAVGVS